MGLAEFTLLLTIVILDEHDFDTSVIVKTFEADEAPLPTIFDLDIPVSIVDDSIDEAEQNFIVYFEVIDAVNSNTYVINRNLAICRIADNDRKYVLASDSNNILQIYSNFSDLPLPRMILLRKYPFHGNFEKLDLHKVFIVIGLDRPA